MKIVLSILLLNLALFGGRQVAATEPGVFAGIEPSFRLVGRQGQLVDQSQFHGRYILLGFGFTHCMHICPVLAANMANALKKSNSDAVGIFISVDTERDTPTITDDYATAFGPDMVGLSGSYEQVKAAAVNFNVSFAVTKTQNNYTVQHTSSIYLIHPDGSLVDVFPFNASPAVMSAAME